jgi:transcriptional regulator with XRE-family HTH domain
VRNLEHLARLGREVRRSRTGRRMTQAQLGGRVGLHAMTIGRIERGLGGGCTLDAWQRVGVALGRSLRGD